MLSFYEHGAVFVCACICMCMSQHKHIKYMYSSLTKLIVYPIYHYIIHSEVLNSL